jgi:hypothetical protein
VGELGGSRDTVALEGKSSETPRRGRDILVLLDAGRSSLLSAVSAIACEALTAAMRRERLDMVGLKVEDNWVADWDCGKKKEGRMLNGEFEFEFEFEFEPVDVWPGSRRNADNVIADVNVENVILSNLKFEV